jgi:hypothetical protein
MHSCTSNRILIKLTVFLILGLDFCFNFSPAEASDWSKDARVEWALPTLSWQSVAGQDSQILQFGALRSSGFGTGGYLVFVLHCQGNQKPHRLVVLRPNDGEWSGVKLLTELDLTQQKQNEICDFLSKIHQELLQQKLPPNKAGDIGGIEDGSAGIFVVEMAHNRNLYQFRSDRPKPSVTLSPELLAQLQNWVFAYSSSKIRDATIKASMRLVSDTRKGSEQR